MNKEEFKQKYRKFILQYEEETGLKAICDDKKTNSFKKWAQIKVENKYIKLEAEKLPRFLKNSIEKKYITIEQAFEIMDFPKDLRYKARKEYINFNKNLVMVREDWKNDKEYLQKRVEYYTRKFNIAVGKIPDPNPEKIDVDQRLIDKFRNIAKQVSQEIQIYIIKKFAEPTQEVCLYIMERIFEHIKKELVKAGKIKYKFIEL